MSVSTEVQRTLVKSPPELWAELGSAEGLARHLGEIGEIRVTKVEPETRVEWEADQASGVVELKQSGWGTKVTLSLTRQAPEPPAEPQPATPEATTSESEAPEPEPLTAQAPALTPESEAPEPQAAGAHDAEAQEPEPETHAPVSEPSVIVEASVESDPIAQATPEPEPKRGFFARLFKRRRRPGTAAQPAPSPMESKPEPETEFHALAQPEPIYPDPPEPTADLGAELAAVEAQMERESTELLTGILDRLGAAHHRPFSRA
ncbi:MAG TPA: hypothetical protein VHU13_04930 [Solirubrobacteraceae bacterium]|jgi:hypothetical protein|nr:hypothetical protein [Solirubrobacteraceae bacterium]